MISVTRDFYALRIHFGDVLHVSLNWRDLIGVHAWSDSDHEYSIEYVLKGGNLVTEYTDVEKWTTILAGLDEIL